jgi:hypothetical protein
MMSNIYRIEGKYPDPQQIKHTLESFRGTEDYTKILQEVKESGMSKHPLLEKFFVES